MGTVISLINHKGGVGKTTITFNLAHALGNKGKKVLVIDSDPQGNLSQCFGFSEGFSLLDFYNGIKDDPIHVNDNIDLLRSDLDLDEAEHKLNSKKVFREGALKNALSDYGFDREYDYILIDCPPSLNIITTNAMVASNHVLIPVKPEFLPYKGLGSINSIISEVREAFNPSLSILGIVFNDVKTNRVLTTKVMENVKDIFGEAVFNTVLRNYVAIAESPISRQSILEYEPNSNAAKDFQAFAEEFMNAVKKNKRP